VALCGERGVPACHVQGAADLDPNWLAGFRTVGLTAGTSTLDATIEEVRLALLRLGEKRRRLRLDWNEADRGWPGLSLRSPGRRPRPGASKTQPRPPTAHTTPARRRLHPAIIRAVYFAVQSHLRLEVFVRPAVRRAGGGLCGEEKRMKVVTESLKVKSAEKFQLTDVTGAVRDWLQGAGVRDGVLNLFSLHTTAVLLVNEFQD